jgi:hypothetical protein
MTTSAFRKASFGKNFQPQAGQMNHQAKCFPR